MSNRNRLRKTSVTLLLALLCSCNVQKSLLNELNKTVSADSFEDCSSKEGYWYGGKCWANFEAFDDGISVEDIDQIVAEELKSAENFKLSLNDSIYNIDFQMAEQDGNKNQIILLTTFSQNKSVKSLLQLANMEQAERKNFETKAILIDGDLTQMEDSVSDARISNAKIRGPLNGVLIDEEAEHYRISGTLLNESNGNEHRLHIEIGAALFGLGNTQLSVEGDKAYLNGTLGTKGYAQIKELIENHSEVKTIVLENVPGSINDAVNMHTGRLIREAGLNTMVLRSSVISSGGVDLFCAGNERIVVAGARLGIHSWGGDGISADDLSKDHPAHQYQLAYFTMCLGKEIGPNFYFRTLSAAPAGEMYWMDDREIKEKIATEFIH